MPLNPRDKVRCWVPIRAAKVEITLLSGYSLKWDLSNFLSGIKDSQVWTAQGFFDEIEVI